jgi:hypothetical protein
MIYSAHLGASIMRLSVSLLITIALICSAQIGLAFDSKASGGKLSLSAGGPAPQSAPTIQSAWIKGKKLIVVGSNFSEGAEIFVNGEKQRTRNDSISPANMLIAKKAGRNVNPEEIARLQVHNSDGLVSDEILFYTGRTVTFFFNYEPPIHLQVGQRFLVDFRGDGRDWMLIGGNFGSIVKPVEYPFIAGTQGLYQAEQVGTATLMFAGTYPCTPSALPCPSNPTIVVELLVDVELI